MTRPISLLIVDDDLEFLELAEQWFSRSAYDVTAVSTLSEAKDHITQHATDAALIDLEFPEGNGTELIEPMRNYGRETAIIVLSGHAEARTIARVMITGADGYLVKPCSLKEIESGIRSALSLTSKVCIP